jgi:hypothetical protein
MNRPVFILMMLAGPWLGPGVRGDTLYLKDGSILVGTVKNEAADRYLLSSPVFGEVAIPRANVVYWTTNDPNILCESYRIMGAGLGVIGHMVRPVPEPIQGRDRFSLLVPGDVWSVTDTAGQPIPFDPRLLGEASHLTVDYNDLPTGTSRLVITTWQAGLLEQTASGDLALCLQYIMDQERAVRVVVTYPAGMTVKAITPQASTYLPGLIVWQRHLVRQQQFTPEVVLGLAGRP